MNSVNIQPETDALSLTIGPLQSSMLEILFCCQYNQIRRAITGRRSGAKRGVSPVQLKEQRPIDEEIGASVDKEVINVRCLRL